MSPQLRLQDAARKRRVAHGAQYHSITGQSTQHHRDAGTRLQGNDRRPHRVFDGLDCLEIESGDAFAQPCGEERLRVSQVPLGDFSSEGPCECGDLRTRAGDTRDSGLEIEALLSEQGIADVEEDRPWRLKVRRHSLLLLLVPLPRRDEMCRRDQLGHDSSPELERPPKDFRRSPFFGAVDGGFRELETFAPRLAALGLASACLGRRLRPSLPPFTGAPPGIRVWRALLGAD
jgi:hypothetical protein